FFFDEAHLLFTDLPKVIEDKVLQLVRLIRSKGVGVYFVTQNPIDIPEAILGQLGNRVQHALRAFTPNDQKAVRAAAQTFRTNPKLNVEKAVTELAIGEALVSFLDEKGTPTIVERALIAPPEGQIGPITPEQRSEMMKTSLVAGVYDTAVDRESAYELLKARAEQSASQQTGAAQGSLPGGVAGTEGTAQPNQPWYGGLSTILTQPTGKTGRGDSLLESMAKSAVRTAGSTMGRQLVRGVLGSLLGGATTRRNR
ncbi:MAG: helicase HerA-like domain-containing protein, partial [Acidobacteriaceae bacterium]